MMTQRIENSQLLRNEPLARYTSWRVGGAADRLFIADSLADLQVFMRTLDHAEPVFLLVWAVICWCAMVACVALSL